MQIITEQKIKVKAELPERDATRKQEVFYNPVMASHRNISILLLNSLPNTKMDIADPLAGSGIRSIRFLRELNRGKINKLCVNDIKENFPKVFKENLRLNSLPVKYLNEKIIVGNEEADHFLLNQHSEKDSGCGYFDYIDLDPFGSPNPFLAAAVARIKRNGILAITATDTAALTGTYPKATKRKYWATSLRNYLMHEIGLRILIRKVQLQGMQFDKALIPILSYHKEHYFRIYFRSEKSKEVCDGIVQQLQYFLFCTSCVNFNISRFNKESCSCGKEFDVAGPLWVGSLADKALLEKMVKENTFPEEHHFLELLLAEAKHPQVGFYDLHVMAHKLKKDPPKMESALKKLKGVRTHFSLTGVKTEKTFKEVLNCFG